MSKQKVLALVSGSVREVPVQSGLTEFGTDPTPLSPGDTWVLRTLENAAGTLQAFVGGIPMVTETDDFLYQLSYRTEAGATVRTILN